MNKLKWLMIVIIVIFLVGCVSREPKIVYITRTKDKFIFISEKYYKDDIKIPKPIDAKTYIKSTPTQREIYNTKLIIELYKTIGLYKIKLYTIGKYQEELKKKLNNKLKE